MRWTLAWLYLMIALASPSISRGEGQPALTHVRDVLALTSSQAAKSLPVHLEATVSYVNPTQGNLFVLQEGEGIYVRFRKEIGLLPGDRIDVLGVTAPSFRSTIIGQSVRFLAHGTLPAPTPVKFEDLIHSKWDCQYVQISGRVLTATVENAPPDRTMRVRIKVPHGTVSGVIAQPGQLSPEGLLDTEIRMTGVAGGEFDGKMQLSGILLEVNSSQNIEILHRAKTSPWDVPLTPMDNVVSSYRYSNQSQRLRISGILIYYEPGSLAVLDHQGRSMMVKTNSQLPLHTGQGVEATGYPVLAQESIGLENAQLRAAAEPDLPTPQTVGWESASIGQHTFDLVAMEGEVVGELHDSRVDLFILQSEGHLFSATLRHSSSGADDNANGSPVPEIGSRVRVTGVCFVDAGNHWRDRLWFDLRMRSLNDMRVLQSPSWWTVKRMAYIVTVLSAVILIAVIWVGLLDRRLRKQSAILARQSQEDAIRERQLARLEQKRSYILEQISSSAPLNDVLREIQTMVSSRLYGASCWFDLHAGSAGGSNVDRPTDPAIVWQELFSPEGASLGYLLTTPLWHLSTDADTSTALLVGARLAELAIETRRLYSDLHHRSEYDLLTDIPNRFFMEKKLDELMQCARRQEGAFGMIYVDLDRFKQVNDRYGHRIGDLYLQEATRRMKMQLRNGDVLARIGGDEFIALVPILRSRVDAVEIAVRLERCFEEPFDLEGYRLHGSASIGLAVYSEDGSNKEELQRSADAAMYAHKQEKRGQTRSVDEFQRSRSELPAR